MRSIVFFFFIICHVCIHHDTRTIKMIIFFLSSTALMGVSFFTIPIKRLFHVRIIVLGNVNDRLRSVNQKRKILIKIMMVQFAIAFIYERPFSLNSQRIQKVGKNCITVIICYDQTICDYFLKNFEETEYHHMSLTNSH